MLAPLLPKLAARGVWHGTFVGLVVDLVPSLVILFWPSHEADADDDRDAAQPEPIVTPRLALPPRAPRVARVGSPVTFGRRGLT